MILSDYADEKTLKLFKRDWEFFQLIRAKMANYSNLTACIKAIFAKKTQVGGHETITNSNYLSKIYYQIHAAAQKAKKFNLHQPFNKEVVNLLLSVKHSKDRVVSPLVSVQKRKHTEDAAELTPYATSKEREQVCQRDLVLFKETHKLVASGNTLRVAGNQVSEGMPEEGRLSSQSVRTMYNATKKKLQKANIPTEDWQNVKFEQVADFLLPTGIEYKRAYYKANKDRIITTVITSFFIIAPGCC